MDRKHALISLLALGLAIVPTSGVLAQDGATEPAVERGILYADDDPKQVIHVFGHEPGGAPRPALAIIHGGGLIWGWPEYEEPQALRYHEQGYVTFLIGYRLFDRATGENPWPAQLDDVVRAIRWIRANADEYGVDPERVCAMGFSSGGHLSGLLGTTEAAADPDFPGISSRVDCVATLAGDGDLTVPYEDEFWNDLFEQILGGTLAEQPELYEAASPAHNVDAETVPFLVVHGVDDEDVPVQMSRNLVAALTAAEREVIYAEVPGDHGILEEDDFTFELLDAFLARHLGGGQASD